MATKTSLTKERPVAMRTYTLTATHISFHHQTRREKTKLFTTRARHNPSTLESSCTSNPGRSTKDLSSRDNIVPSSNPRDGLPHVEPTRDQSEITISALCPKLSKVLSTNRK
jgi:hypothetical protein